MGPDDFQRLNQRERRSHYRNTRDIWSELYNSVTNESKPQTMSGQSSLPAQVGPNANTTASYRPDPAKLGAASLIQLTPQNFQEWKADLTDVTNSYLLGWMLQNPSTPPPDLTPEQVMQSCSEVRHLMMSNINDSVRIRLEPDTQSHPPNEIVLILQQLLADTSPQRHERLEAQARALTFTPDKSVDEHVDAHRALRREMRQAEFPGILSEAVTIRFMMAGLHTHPLYADVARMLTIFGAPTTIQDFQDRILAISNTPQHPAPPAKPIPRRQYAYRRKKPNPNLQRMIEEAVEKAIPKQQTTTRRRLGRKGHANAARHQGQAGKFILDSGACPSLLKYIPRNARPLTTKIPITSALDDDQKGATHQGKITLRTTAGKCLRKKAMSSPSLTNNLLSVSEIARTTPILFTEKGAYIVDRRHVNKIKTELIAKQRQGLETTPVQANAARTILKSSPKPLKITNTNNHTTKNHITKPQKPLTISSVDLHAHNYPVGRNPQALRFHQYPATQIMTTKPHAGTSV